MERLITKEDIGKYREVARGVRDDKINPYIDDAHFLDIRKLLGTTMYSDVINRKDDPKINTLLEGGEYQHKDDVHYNPGLKRVLCHFSFSRYILFGGFTDTSFGFVQKSNNDSQPVSQTSKRDIHKQERQTAVEYWKEVALFLNRKSDDYPKWRRDCETQTFGLKISKITLD